MTIAWVAGFRLTPHAESLCARMSGTITSAAGVARYQSSGGGEMASTKPNVNRVIFEIVSSFDRLAPMERLQVLERLLGATLCAHFGPEHEAKILHDIAGRITAVNTHIRKQLEREAATTKPRHPGTAH